MGRRFGILCSLVGSTVGLTFTGFAQNYGMFLAARFLTGSFGGSTPVAQAYIIDVVPVPSRPRYLAFITASMSMAYIVGPAIGSGLATFNIRVPFFAAGMY